jgi:PKD repeat protein
MNNTMRQIFFQNTKTVLSTLMLCVLMCNACKEDDEISSVVVDGNAPVASFESAINYLEVTFTNKSNDAETYYWQFGDGSTSTETSPVHAYSVAGNYTVILKTTSAAGYSDTCQQKVYVAGAATASFSATSVFGLYYYMDGSGSTNYSSVAWDFGDGTTSSTVKNYHTFPANGTYTVKITVTGLLGDVVVYTEDVVVADKNMLKGGDMESDQGYWLVWSSQTDNYPDFGYTADKPTAGVNGCLRFPSYSSSGALNELIYQAVNVEAGKKYLLSAVVKTPEGGSYNYLQFYISTDANTWIEHPTAAGANMYLGLNNWAGWGSYGSSTNAVDGDLYTATLSNGEYGLGVQYGGVYTFQASATGTVYIGIQCGVWNGRSNGDILVDNVSFTLVE